MVQRHAIVQRRGEQDAVPATQPAGDLPRLPDITGKGQLKFVVSNRPEAWDELEERVDEFRNAGIHWPVWIMPVGATIESQSDDDMRAVVDETIKRGYNVSARLQAYIWGNTIGT